MMGVREARVISCYRLSCMNQPIVMKNEWYIYHEKLEYQTWTYVTPSSPHNNEVFRQPRYANIRKKGLIIPIIGNRHRGRLSNDTMSFNPFPPPPQALQKRFTTTKHVL